MPSRGEGATSGFVDMLGSTLGGVTEMLGSTRLSGVCTIPGSIREGGIAGIPDSDGFSGDSLGACPGPLSGAWPGGSPSAARANAGKRLKMAMATSRAAFPAHHLVENIFTSSSVIIACWPDLTDAYFRTPDGHRNRARLFLLLGN